MEIKFKSTELDKRKLYQHTRGSAISLKDVEDGTVITPAEIVIYEDQNSAGDPVLITSIIAEDGKHYATNSRIFREELGRIYHLADGDPFDIRIVKKLSKGGRTYINCEWA